MINRIFIFCVLVVFIGNISFFKITATSNTYIGWLLNFTYIVGMVLLIPSTYKKGKQIEWLYIGIMLLGLILHACLPQQEKYPIANSTQWIFLIVIIIASRKYHSPRLLFYILITFFLTHCLLAIIEYKLQTNLFDYSFVENFKNFSEGSKNFRAFGLMEHPLYAANVTVIIMSFIMISKDINRVLQMMLLSLGIVAMVSFNSRAGLVICGSLLVYRFLLFNIKLIYIIVLGALVYSLFFSDIISVIKQNDNIFGRLSAKESLSDGSSLTRVLSYYFFWNTRWNFQDIVFGGRIIYMPGTDLSLENGVLLTISWWGWLVGTTKVLLELYISYMYLNKYRIKEKMIVMIACWGTAFANNNSINTFVFAFFIISFISFNSLEIRRKSHYLFETQSRKTVVEIVN